MSRRATLELMTAEDLETFQDLLKRADEALRENLEERAAIIEFDGELSREEAERRAVALLSGVDSVR